MAKSTEWIKKVEGFVEQLAGEMDAVRASELYQKHLDTAAKFWHYSWSNQLLILLQNPEATLVAGYRRWQEMKRQVKKGEKGIRILAPGIKKVEVEDQDEDGRVIQYFFPVTVFDISQTDGEEWPLIDCRVGGNQGRIYFDALVSHCIDHGIDVKLESMSYGHYGSSRNGEIVINDDHDWNTKFGTAVHELAHEYLHWNGDISTKQRWEAEAEGASYVVLKHFDIPTSAPSYLALRSTDTKILSQSIANISEAAKRIIAGIEANVEVEVA